MLKKLNSEEADSNLHKEHRERVKNRFKKEGIEHFEPHNMLELLLFFSIPQGDTNELAHTLIREFGSFDRVLDADFDKLLNVSGVGKHTATLLTLIPQLLRYYVNSKNELDIIIPSSHVAGQYILPKYIGVNEETILILHLDAKKKLINTTSYTSGSMSFANIDIRQIVDAVLKNNSQHIIIAHNHPYGLAIPSQDDIKATMKIRDTLKTIGVILDDHIIVADNDYTSFSDSAYLL